MVEDLSKYHRPIGRLLDCRSRAEDWDGYRLSEEQLEFFQENGYLKGIRILSDEQVEVLRGELEQLMNPEHPGAAFVPRISFQRIGRSRACIVSCAGRVARAARVS